VMVMADDGLVRDNRLALLAEVRALFRGVADVGQLQR
jgi:glycyl-tRNA synthetase beta subunit